MSNCQRFHIGNLYIFQVFLLSNEVTEFLQQSQNLSWIFVLFNNLANSLHTLLSLVKACMRTTSCSSYLNLFKEYLYNETSDQSYFIDHHEFLNQIQNWSHFPSINWWSPSHQPYLYQSQSFSSRILTPSWYILHDHCNNLNYQSILTNFNYLVPSLLLLPYFKGFPSNLSLPVPNYTNSSQMAGENGWWEHEWWSSVPWVWKNLHVTSHVVFYKGRLLYNYETWQAYL